MIRSSNIQVAHDWMSSEVREGQNYRRTLFYTGDVIYSYGFHYPIARRDAQKKVIFWNMHPSTSSTSKQYATVGKAVDRAYKSIWSLNPEAPPEKQLDIILDYIRRRPNGSWNPRRREDREVLNTLRNSVVSVQKIYHPTQATVQYTNDLLNEFKDLYAEVDRGDERLEVLRRRRQEEYEKRVQDIAALEERLLAQVGSMIPVWEKSEEAARLKALFDGLDNYQFWILTADYLSYQRWAPTKPVPESSPAVKELRDVLYGSPSVMDLARRPNSLFSPIDRDCLNHLVKAEVVSGWVADRALKLYGWNTKKATLFNTTIELTPKGAIVTSKGLIFKPKDVKTVAELVCRGEEYMRADGKDELTIGSYPVTSISLEGDILAGCHHICGVNARRVVVELYGRGLLKP